MSVEKRKIVIFSKIDGKYCISYSLKPEKINNRKGFGHWETDLIVITKWILSLINVSWKKIKVGNY